MDDLKIKEKEQSEIGEKLTNEKPWFNGVHSFSSVHIVTPKQPSVLGIGITEEVKIKEKIS